MKKNNLLRIILFFVLLLFLVNYDANAIMFTDEEISKQVQMIKEGGKKFLIINADDFGLSTNINKGIIEVLTKGIATSTSVIITGQKVNEVVEFQKKYKTADIGIHLDLTSEKDLKLGPITQKEKVPSLFEPGTAFFPTDIVSVITKADPEEVKIETLAQIELAKKMGINLTHIDCHSGWYHLSKDLFDAIFPYIVENRFPARETVPYNKRRLKKAGIKIIDNLILFKAYTYEEVKKQVIYNLKALPVGINEMFFHPAYAEKNKELEWRDIDRRILLDEDIKKVIKEEGIVLIGYRPLQILSK